MGIVLVTGLSGSGKSAVLRELRARGHEVLGFDEDRFGEWFSRTSGRVVAFPTERTDGDIADLDFKVHRDRIERLAREVDDRRVYLCGGAGHEFHFWELLDRVIYLAVDDHTLTARLAARTDNGYGKLPDELTGILEANATWSDLYRERGASIVNAARPIADVVDDVVRLADTPM